MPACAADQVITVPARSTRNYRNNPYPMDELMRRTRHSAIGTLWRFRTELIIPPILMDCVKVVSLVLPAFLAVVSVAAAITVVLVLPWTRRQVIRRAWCVMSRHRIQRVCYETRMHTRSGRLPLVLRITPTEVGERALIWCRAGICAEDFEAHAGEIAAACYAGTHQCVQTASAARHPRHRAPRHPRPAQRHHVRPARRLDRRTARFRRLTGKPERRTKIPKATRP
jgi:hypothetical protein